MVQLSDRLHEAIDSDCAHSLEEVITQKSDEDFQGLQALLSLDAKISPGQRNKALHLLGRWNNPAAVPAILKILPELDEIGRSRAVDALGKIGSPDAIKAVIERAADPSASVRKFVVHALSRTDQPDTRQKLQEMEQSDNENFIRELVQKVRAR